MKAVIREAMAALCELDDMVVRSEHDAAAGARHGRCWSCRWERIVVGSRRAIRRHHGPRVRDGSHYEHRSEACLAPPPMLDDEHTRQDDGRRCS